MPIEMSLAIFWRSKRLAAVFAGSELRKLEMLYELNVATNQLSCLPPSLTQLPKLVVLRAHSNYLRNLPDFRSAKSLRVRRTHLIGSRPSDHCFRSVCWFVCLFVCAEFFSAVFDPISIKLGHMLYVLV